MSEEINAAKLNKISGKNCVKYGYSSGNIRENKMRFGEKEKWNFNHKPYQNDYRSDLINK